jgi:hypothetical protein
MKIHQLSLFLLLGSVTVFAQKDKEIPTESVEVVKEFDARLLETTKVSVTPLLPALDTFTKRQDYVIPPKPLAVKYDAPKLRPIGMKSSAKEKLYNGWAKLGAGVPTSLYGEGGYYLAKKDKFDAKIWARHHSANFKSNENQRFMENDLLLNGNAYLTKNTALEAKVGYKYNRVHYYGYDHKVDTFSAERVRQDFKMPEIAFRFYNSERTSNDLNYSIQPRVYFLTDYYSNKETGFDLNMSATKWFAEKHPFRMNIRTDFTSYRDTATQKLNNIYLQPSFTFHADFMKLKIGGNFASNRDVFSIFPDAELVLRIWGDGIQLFAGATGDLRKNTYRSISEYNPFIQMRGSRIENTKYYNYFGGLKGNLGWLEYSAQGGYSTAANLALFQTMFETGEPTRFEVLYDSAKIVNLQGSIKLVPIKNLTVTGTLSQNIYNMAKESNAWGLPGLEGNFTGKYTLLDNKVAVKTEVYIADKIRRRGEDNLPGKDGALVDISLGGSYMVAKNFGVFLDINNILNNKRQRWHNYANYGTNIMVGVQVKF